MALDLEFVKVLVAQTSKHIEDFAYERQQLLLVHELAHLFLKGLINQVVDLDLVLPVGVRLAHVVFDWKVWDLLMDQSHLYTVTKVRGRWPPGGAFVVKSTPCAHRQTSIRDANIVEHLEFVPKDRRLPFH